ncbi:carboxymuconolactone decarboxylase family protein [Neorhizobium galegae]|uniref:carboxymuconolactone decarboxylase family protein n=1 Tax=Neorhizobium galegae TaxID=399 RepID=UPI00210596F6|nr:carboxymuconolactone decarboxylase family protein [Neorhizobium galegae]MCQ1855963.1 carboxymuconolactone decarboxylase family protein [Neorhizobium galegae]
MTQRLDYNAASPNGMKALAGVYAHIGRSSLPKSLIELVYLRISQINGCVYCIDMHSRDLLTGGMEVEKLVLVQSWREAGSLFNEGERAALAWTETVTRVAQTGVPDEDFEAASAAFDSQELADLTSAIGLMNAYNRMAISFRAPPAAVQRASASNSAE